MKTTPIRLLLVLSFLPVFLFSQTPSLKLKLQLLPDGETWGVYVKPNSNISPSLNTITGSAQVTVVMPKNYAWNGLVSVHGSWVANAIVDGPVENPGRSYVSFGLGGDVPNITYQAGQETLLFKFKRDGACPDSLYLINNGADPFNQTPNSINSNPGSEFTVFDAGVGLYSYQSNYATSAWSCHDNDGDNIPNALEDTDGNGQWNPGVDASNLNEPEPGLRFKLQLMPDGETWGVYVKPDSTLSPSPNTITGSAQATVVMPLNYQWNGLTSVHGAWSANAVVNGPVENPGRSYVSFGLVADVPQIVYQTGQETLLFKFKRNGACPDSLYLFDNETDPFNCLPNDCIGSGFNPGNEITVFDAAIGLYSYSGNYAPFAWNCHDNDGDNIPNALEDTNGNGVFDVGVDSSDLNDGCIAALTIENQPQPVSECTGNSTSFSVTVSNAGQGLETYQWQYIQNANIEVWQNLTDGNVFSGTASPELSISNVANFNGCYFRVLIQKMSCPQITSDSARLTVTGNFSFSQQPANQTTCSFGSANFTAHIGNPIGNVDTVHYQWQYSSDSINYSDIIAPGINGFAGMNSSSLFISIAQGLDGWRFRLAARLGECNYKYSQPAMMAIEDGFEIIAQPEDTKICNTGEAVFFANAIYCDSTELNNQWQISTDGGTNWQDVLQNVVTIDGQPVSFSGYDGDSLLIYPLTGLNGLKVRNIYWVNSVVLDTTDAATLHIEGPIAILEEPDDVQLCYGDSASISVMVENFGEGPLQFQWQVSFEGGINWYNLAQSGPYSFSMTLPVLQDSTTGAVSIITLNIGENTSYNAKYRCRINTPHCDYIYSAAAQISLGGPILVLENPTDISSCEGDEVQFTATIDNIGQGSVNYHWQQSLDGGLTWNIINKSDSMLISAASDLDGSMYRMQGWTGTCDTTSTEAAILTVADCLPGCLKIKLQLLPDSSGWAVMAKPFGAFVPSANALTTAGRVTLVAPADFVLDGFSSEAGTWMPVNVTDNLPNHPGRKYITFELIPQPGLQGEAIPYGVGQETSLFQFDKTGPCPDSLYLMEGNIPAALLPNELSGSDLDNLTVSGFELCGVYARKAWRCKPPVTVPPVIIVTGGEADSLAAPSPGEVAARGAVIFEKENAEGGWFSASPNPTSGQVQVLLEKELAEGRATLSLWDLQGKKWREEAFTGNSHRLEIGDLPPGLYVLTLKMDGRILQRKKLIKT
ncbi:MAG: T9SS type A sorting domain-containing protein [Bacteroidetes bacterium]|nr:T9SS type A sorting domain-containing protein [Bacteroidota bacterium]